MLIGQGLQRLYFLAQTPVQPIVSRTTLKDVVTIASIESVVVQTSI